MLNPDPAAAPYGVKLLVQSAHDAGKHWLLYRQTNDEWTTCARLPEGGHENPYCHVEPHQIAGWAELSA